MDSMYPGEKLWTPYAPDMPPPPLDLSFTTGSPAISSSSQTPSPSVSPAGSSSVSPEISTSVSPAGSSSVSLEISTSVSPAGSSSVIPAGPSSVGPVIFPGVSPAGPSSVSLAERFSLGPVISPSVSPGLVPYVVPCVLHQHIDQSFAVARGQNPLNATSRCASPQLPSTVDVLPLMPYDEYEKIALSVEAKSNGGSLVTNNPKMRRAVQTKRNADPNYLLQRQKNNEAAKKSRDLRKIREKTHIVRIKYLEKLLAQMLNLLCPVCKSTIRFEHAPELDDKHV